MKTLQDEYKTYRGILSDLFDNMKIVDNALQRFATVKGEEIVELHPRLHNLLSKCGNFNAVKEFLVYLVFENCYINHGDISYYLSLMGEFEELCNSMVYKSMNNRGKKYIRKLFLKQYNRVKTFSDFIFSSLEKTNIEALDIGCGIGQLSYMLASKGLSVTAIDLNVSQGIEIQKKIAQKWDFAINVNFLKGNALDLEFIGQRKYHLVTLCDVVEHINEKEKLFSEIDKMLDTGGVIAIHTDNLILQRIVKLVKKSLLIATFRNPKIYEFAWSGGDGGHTGLCTPKMLANIFKKMNYKCMVDYDKDSFAAKLCPVFFSKGFKILAIKQI